MITVCEKADGFTITLNYNHIFWDFVMKWSQTQNFCCKEKMAVKRKKKKKQNKKKTENLSTSKLFFKMRCKTILKTAIYWAR